VLTAVPALVGSVLRIPYTFAVARFGGRNWTIVSAGLLLIPTLLAAFLIEPGVSYTTLICLAAAAGVAGTFGTPVGAAYLTFLGPLLGSLIRPVGGALADRLGGARVTFVTFVAMAAGAGTVLLASQLRSLPLCLIGFVALFAVSGIGNGSTYKMIPAIFRAKHPGAEHEARRLSGSVIGIAGARRRVRRGAGQPRVPAVVPDLPDGGRRVPHVHRLLRGVRAGHLGGLPPAVRPQARGCLTPALVCGPWMSPLPWPRGSTG
jgi:nitrate/nitrite transporter NarK